VKKRTKQATRACDRRRFAGSRLLEEGVFLVVVGAGHRPPIHEVCLVLLTEHGRQSDLVPAEKGERNTSAIFRGDKTRHRRKIGIAPTAARMEKTQQTRKKQTQH